VKGFDFFILATDISTQMLSKGARAIYDEERIAPIPLELRRKYLLRSKDRSKRIIRVAPDLRDRVRFRRLNFMDSDFGMREPIDIIFCRNVFIYFDRQTQERILHNFCRHLIPGGYVFMGHSESINGLDVPLVQVAPSVYRKPG
jgi:chemotaxis protein methyltransferase CheR